MTDGKARTSDVRTFASGFHFLESPRWHAGELFASDAQAGQVLAFQPSGHHRVVCTVDAQPGGLGFDADGRLLVVSMLDARLLRLDPDGLVEVARTSSAAAGAANDMVIDPAGRAFIGHFGFATDGVSPITATNLVRVDTSGAVTVAAADLVFANGMAISPDGRLLIVAETFACRLTAFDVDPGGKLSGRREWARFDTPRSANLLEVIGDAALLPDGIAMDAEGAVWVADAKGCGATRIRPGGAVVDFVPTGDLSVYAVALGGEDGRTLFMCVAPPIGTSDLAGECRSALLTVDVDVPGAGRP